MSKLTKIRHQQQRLCRKMVSYQDDAFGEDLNLMQAEADLKAMDNSSSAQDQALNAKQVDVNEAEARTAQLYARGKEVKKQTADAMEDASPETADKARIIREEGEPELDELRVQQEDLEAKLNCTVDVSHVVLEHYDKRAKEIEDLEAEVESGQASYDQGVAKRNEVLGRWLPRLENLIEAISERFTAALEREWTPTRLVSRLC